MVYTTGRARIRHAQSGEIYEIDAADIVFNELDAEERSMGAEVTYVASVDHPQLGQLVWNLWEYPVGAENDRDTDIGEHELLSNIDFGLDSPTIAEERDERVQQLIDWFAERYEDPVHEMPHNSREGGYQYIYGGPYDAHDELSNNFPDVDEAIINAAVEELESDGVVDWAPVHSDEAMDEFYESMRGAEDDDNVVTELERLIDAAPAPQTDPIFSIMANGVVGLLESPDTSDAPGGDLVLEELRAVSTALLETLDGTNSHTVLLEAAGHYNEALQANSFSIQRLYARGVRFQNLVSEIDVLIKKGDLPPPPEGTRSDLNSMLDLHAAYVMSQPAGRDLAEAAERFQQVPENAAMMKSAAQEIRDAVENASGLFTDEVRAMVTTAVNDIGRGPQPQRSDQVAGTTLGNLGISLIKCVREQGINTLVGGAITTSAVGAATITSGAAGIDAVWAFLVANAQAFHFFAGALGTDLGWAEPMSRIFERLSMISLNANKK